MIGLSAAALLVFNGRIAGISGILGGLINGAEDRAWRGAFVLGLLGAGFLLRWFAPQSLPGSALNSIPALIVAGILVGFGTRMGGGCTSGHGVCGMSRLSTRSLLATGIFMSSAIITVGIIRHVFGGLS